MDETTDMTDLGLSMPRLNGDWKNLAGWKPPKPTFPDPRAPNRSAWISARCRQIVSAYRKDDFADADGFSVLLGTVLERYGDEIIDAVASPLGGIVRTCKFPPTIAEVVEWCDTEVERRKRIAELGALRLERREPRLRATSFANVLVRCEAPQYPRMMKLAAEIGESREWRNDEQGRGIWVIRDWLDGRAPDGR